MQYGQVQAAPQYGQTGMRIQQGTVFSPAPHGQQSQGSLKTDIDHLPLQMTPTTLIPYKAPLPPSGPSRQASPPPHQQGSFVAETPQTARMWQHSSMTSLTPQTSSGYPLPRMPSQNQFTPPMNVAHAADLTISTVPVTMEGQPQQPPPLSAQQPQQLVVQQSQQLASQHQPHLAHGPSSQVSLERMSSLHAPVHIGSSEEVVTTRNSAPNSWVQCSPMGERGIVRQKSANALGITRMASSSPSRSASARTMEVKNKPVMDQVQVATQLHLSNVEKEVKDLPQVLAKDLASKEDLNQLESKFTEQSATLKSALDVLTKGVDTSENARKMLQSAASAKSVGELRCAIQRAEETRIPEDELLIYREQLVREERREAARAAEEARIEVSRLESEKCLRAEHARFKEDFEKERRSASQLGERLRKEEQAMRVMREERQRLNEDKITCENERNRLQALNISLEQKLAEKQAESNDFKKTMTEQQQRIGQLVEELNQECATVKQLRSEQAVNRSQFQQQADSITALQSEVRSLREQLSRAQGDKENMRQELAKTKQQEQANLVAKDKENIELKKDLDLKITASQELGRRNYDLETKLRKANWNMKNPSPAQWLEAARQRDMDNNTSRENAQLRKQNQELKTTFAEQRKLEQVMWNHMPSDKEIHIQHDLEAMKSRGRVIQ